MMLPLRSGAPKRRSDGNFLPALYVLGWQKDEEAMA
jgi:hypothetical protein